MPTTPIDAEDIAARQALRAEFARFWSTEQSDPRAVYDRFIEATPVKANVFVQRTDDGPAAGTSGWPDGAASDSAVLFRHGGGYGVASAPGYAGLVSHLSWHSGVSAFALEYPLAAESQLPEALDLAVATLTRMCHDHATWPRSATPPEVVSRLPPPALTMDWPPSDSTIPTLPEVVSRVQLIWHRVDLAAQIDGNDVGALLCEADRVAANLPTGASGDEGRSPGERTHAERHSSALEPNTFAPSDAQRSADHGRLVHRAMCTLHTWIP